MPAKILMKLSNGGNNYPQFQRSINNDNLANVSKNVSGLLALKLGMISRIHSVRPGCGSCGRH